MDDETGEISSSLHTRTNPETGEEEFVTYFFNDETGEKEYFSIARILSCLQMNNPFRISRYTTELFTAVRQGKSTSKRPSELRTEFITAIVFLIPTIIIFSPLLGLLVLSFDIILHKWCHRQNAKLKLQGNDSIYYQSPLHPLYKEFCSKCVADNDCKKINKIQNIRYNRKRNIVQESLRRVVT